MPVGVGPPPDLAARMAILARRRQAPTALELIRRAIELLERAREMDTKVERSVSLALDALRGVKREEAGGSPEKDQPARPQLRRNL